MGAGSRRREFGDALEAAPLGILAAATVLQLVALVSRTEAWHVCVGVDASVLDAIAVLIAMVTLSQLPVGPTVGAAAVVVILGANGVALAAAAGVLLRATGTAGAIAYAAWAATDRLWMLRPAAPRRAAGTLSGQTQPAMGGTR